MFSFRRAKRTLTPRRIIATTTSRARQDLSRPRPPEMLGKQFVQQLDKALHLTPEHTPRLPKIVAGWPGTQPRDLDQCRTADCTRCCRMSGSKFASNSRAETTETVEELLKRFRPPGHHPQPPPNSPPPTNEPADDGADQSASDVWIFIFRPATTSPFFAQFPG